MVIDTLSIYEKLKESIDPAAAEKIAGVLGETLSEVERSMREASEQRLSRIEQTLETLVEVSRQHSQEIAELREATQRNTEAIAELREATQRNTEAIAELREATQRNTEAIAELREATQRNTEAIAELRETVNRLLQVSEQHSREIAELREMVRENTEAIAELRQMVRENTQAIGELRAAVRELTATTRRLEMDQQDIRKQLGGLSMSVGYRLEDEAYVALPRLLQRDYGLQVLGRLKRDYALDNEGKYIEVNIWGQAERDGQVFTIVGESKVQLSANDIDRFLRRKLKRLQGIYPNLFPVIVTHMITSPDVSQYAERKGVAVYFSYDFAQ